MFDQSVNTLDIDLLIVPDTNLILLAAVIEPLRAANRISGDPLYRWRIFSSDGAPAGTTSQIPIPVAGQFDPQRSEPLFVIASYDWRRHSTKLLKTQLSRAAKHRSVIVGVESGTWFLADSGLLDGSAATIHWEDHKEFSASYPHVTLRPDRYVIDRKHITTGGPMPTLDLMLEIVRSRQGYSLALEISRLFCHSPARSGSDDNSTAMPAPERPKTLDPRVDRALQIMEDNIELPLPISSIAEQIGVSARHLREMFRDNASTAPSLHYLTLRLNAARRMLIESGASVTEIAAAAGFSSAATFSRSYRMRFGESASETRRRLNKG